MNILATQGSLGALHEVITKHGNLVKRIAHHLLGKLPASIQVEDLMQAGMIGLLEAHKNYDQEKGASFETYAGIRVRGAMLDEVRKGDWVPRSVHKNSRKIAAAIKQVENDVGRYPKNREVAKAMGISLSDYHQLLKESIATKIFGFEDIGLNDDSIHDGSYIVTEPLDKVQSSDFKRYLMEVIASLPAREKLVLSLYYQEELNLKEVGEVLGVSESRVSQIHSQAMLRLQAKVKREQN